MSRTAYNIHSDFKKLQKIKLPTQPPLLRALSFFFGVAFEIIKPIAGIRESKEIIQGYKNGKLRVKIYEPENIKDKAPCLIYFHGGGFTLKAAPYLKRLVYQYALRTPCKVIYADYRLLPKYPFPVGAEDCYSTYEWACENAQRLGIDKERIAVAGDSAGGTLAAAVCLMSRDRKNPAGICFQMLIYPAADARQNTDSIKRYEDAPVWNSDLNRRMWKRYLKNGAGEHPEYASPVLARSFEGLPPAYVEVAEFDCLRDEGAALAECIKGGGAQVELYESLGTIHGYEMAAKSGIVAKSIDRRIDALRRHFKEA
ncbi:MAG: alpha/beta hydrolase [Clostridiales bacterium]|jgi:acetyl esterase/lipase|nr:alpha/beta hydrolase [Clostridiales bacterium]